jgi:hypothetical protein
MDKENQSSKEFFEFFNLQFASLLGEPRSSGFQAMLSALDACSGEGVLIVETGGLRLPGNFRGYGQSTVIFDAYVQYRRGQLISVDLDPVCALNTRHLCSLRTTAVTADAVSFLNLLSSLGEERTIDLLYLDSMDLDQENPAPSAQHHLKEVAAIMPRLKPGALIAVDDNPIVNDRRMGKGYLVEEFLSGIGAKKLYDGYQVLWQI